MGYYLKQVKGPALGIYQMEPATAWWLVKKYSDFVYTYFNEVYTLEEALIGDLYFQTVLCRFKYYSISEPLPSDPNDLVALARYWKKYYNTHLGKGTEEEFIKNYNRYVK